MGTDDGPRARVRQQQDVGGREGEVIAAAREHWGAIVAERALGDYSQNIARAPVRSMPNRGADKHLASGGVLGVSQ